MRIRKYKNTSFIIILISILISLITLNPLLIVSGVLALGLFFVDKYILVRLFLNFIFVVYIYLLLLLIIKHHFFILEDYINFIWICFFTSALFVKIYFSHPRNERKIFWVSFVAIFVCFIAYNFSIDGLSHNYDQEIEMVLREKSFINSKDVIQIPLNKCLIVKSRYTEKLCLLRINKFKKTSFHYSSVLLRRKDKNYYTVETTKNGEIYYDVLSYKIFNGFEMAFLPVNSIVKYQHYYYGHTDINIPFFDINTLIYLPEDQIFWFSKKNNHCDSRN